MEPGYRSRYSDLVWAGQLRCQRSSPGGGKNFLFSMSSIPVLGPTQHPTQGVPGVQWPGREADHFPPTSAEVKKKWIYTSTWCNA
jgi:hypothetical protein